MSEETEFPKNIKGFGYKFNEKGELRNIETGMLTELYYSSMPKFLYNFFSWPISLDERFLFFVKPEDRSYNQRHYEELGGTVNQIFINV